MFIHWFPGHMAKALREMEIDAVKVDCIVYVLDARIPFSSVNPAYDKIFQNKPRLYVLNKADLVPEKELEKWLKYYNSNGNICVFANSIVNGGNKTFIQALKKISSNIVQKYQQKGVNKTIRAMVIGVPNCGKSTLINSLIKKKRTVTGNKPGVTRGKQWVSIDKYIDLMDTPGTLFPDFSDQRKATALAMVGSIKEDILDFNQLAIDIINFLITNYPKQMQGKYGEEILSIDKPNYLEYVAKKRGFILKGNEMDIDRAGKAIVSDFKKNAFGKIIIEKYDNIFQGAE